MRRRARECEEEIGLAPRKVTRLRGYYPTPGFCDEEMIYYRCEDLRPPAPDSTARKDDDEDIEPRTLDDGRGARAGRLGRDRRPQDAGRPVVALIRETGA